MIAKALGSYVHHSKVHIRVLAWCHAWLDSICCVKVLVVGSCLVSISIRVRVIGLVRSRRFDRFVFTEVLFHSWEVLVRVWYEVADSRSICIKFGLIDLWCQCKVVLKCCVPSCRTWLVRNVRIVAVFA